MTVMKPVPDGLKIDAFSPEGIAKVAELCVYFGLMFMWYFN
jgi:hypothetical protein